MKRVNGIARSRATPLAGLFLLSLLWACGMLRADLLPDLFSSGMPTYQRQALSYLLFAMVAGLLALVQQVPWPQSRLIWNSVLIGLGLFVIPGGLLWLADGRISGYERMALFTLVPVFTVVFEPYWGGDSTNRMRGGLAGALVAFVGASLVFPVELPTSVASAQGYLAVILAGAFLAATNCRAVAVVAEFPDESVVAAAAIAGMAAAIVFAGASIELERGAWTWDALGPEALWHGLVELPVLLLLFWLMRRMPAVGMSTRFVFAPLITVVLGAAALREPLRLLTWLGLLLMAVGGGYLLWGHAGKPEDELLSITRNIAE